MICVICIFQLTYTLEITTQLHSNQNTTNLDQSVLDRQIAAAYAAAGLENQGAYIYGTTMLQGRYPNDGEQVVHTDNHTDSGINVVLIIIIVIALLFSTIFCCWYNSVYPFGQTLTDDLWPNAKQTCVDVKIQDREKTNQQKNETQDRRTQYGSFTQYQNSSNNPQNPWYTVPQTPATQPVMYPDRQQQQPWPPVSPYGTPNPQPVMYPDRPWPSVSPFSTPTPQTVDGQREQSAQQPAAYQYGTPMPSSNTPQRARQASAGNPGIPTPGNTVPPWYR